jgi:hypothetical protein
MSSERRLGAWIAGTTGLGLLAALAPLVLGWQHVPEPLATHFGASGVPNGQMSRVGWASMLALMGLVPAFASWPYARAPVPVRGAGLRLGAVGFGAGLNAVLSALLLWHNWERGSWRDARPFEAWSIALVLAAPLLLGLPLGVLANRWWPDAPGPVEGTREALPLASGERAYWSGTASNGWFALVALFVMLEGAAFQLMFSRTGGNTFLLVVHLSLLLVLELLSKIRVTVNERGLTIRYGRLGLLRQRIALDRIQSAAHFELDPWQNGGWGYRGSLRLGARAAVVVRAGSALRLALRDGKQLLITVDDADTGARLINGFLQRAPA